ncbi:hypothetical protein LWC33_02655 [Pseudonocardia sp. RS11V-5]|uniref:hypothetical protein n=1 Tax=Pseudonocardia terrae TaxID=2905831 RepID=UPI001E4557A9|nr:hypothetical protein [Pseudonocardia terrae]MCE3550359.1 hypothetical protein [Pseudonocardia terrae]
MNNRQGSTRPPGRQALGTVGIAVIVAAVLGAVLPVVCARLMPASDYQYFLAYWGLLFGLGSAISPVEQEVSRQAALASVVGAKAGSSSLQAVGVVFCGVLLFGMVVALPLISIRLFGQFSILALIAAAGGAAFVGQFGMRGLLIGQNEVRRYAGLIVAEALIRAVLVGAVIVAAVVGMYSLALAVVAGSFMWLLFVRRAVVLVDWRGGRERWAAVTRRMGVLVAASGLTACLITGYPAMVNFISPGGDGEAVGGLFAALTVARLPLLLLSPVQALAVPTVVRLSADENGRQRLHRLMLRGSAGALLLAAVGAAFGALVGPFLVRLLFGVKYNVPALAVAGLVWSSVLLAAILLLAAVLVARKQVGRVLITWALAVALSVAVLAGWPGDTVTKATVGLVVAPTVSVVVAAAFVLGDGRSRCRVRKSGRDGGRSG